MELKSKWSERAKEVIFDLFYRVFVWCRFVRISLGRGILSMNMLRLEDLSMKLWFLVIILANIRRMEMKSRWSGRAQEVVSNLY